MYPDTTIRKMFAGISKGPIKTLVSMEEGRFTVWHGEVIFVGPILERWGPPKRYMSVGVKHLHEALKIYKPVRDFDEILVMVVSKEGFIFKPVHKPDRLESEELWHPSEKKARIVYGIRVNGKIVSRGGVSRLIKDVAGVGAFMFTDEEHGGKGYATSALSYAVRDALKEVPQVVYTVESTVPQAIKVLHKSGFRWHSSFLYTGVEKCK